MPNCSETNYKCGIACTDSKRKPSEQAYYRDCATNQVGFGSSYQDARNLAAQNKSRKLTQQEQKDLLKNFTCDWVCESMGSGTKELCQAKKFEKGCGGGPLDEAVKSLAPKVDDSDKCGGCDEGDIGCAIGKYLCEAGGVAGDSLPMVAILAGAIIILIVALK